MRYWRRDDGKYSSRRRKRPVREPLRTRDLILKHAKSAPCMDCGGTFPPEAMDFDHRPGTTKVANISSIKTLADLAVELEKCDLVCAICHRVRTRKRLLGAYASDD